jgi:hypothetical protein
MAGMLTFASVRGIVRICVNRISYSETWGAKIFCDSRMSHGLVMKDRFMLDMDRAHSAPRGQKQATWSLIHLAGVLE